LRYTWSGLSRELVVVACRPVFTELSGECLEVIARPETLNGRDGDPVADDRMREADVHVHVG
jgi:hypothetical protein